jgi:hypothetical protein
MEAPHTNSFSMIQQLATCYEYWDWKYHAPGALPEITREVRDEICRKLKAKTPTGTAHIQEYLATYVEGGAFGKEKDILERFFQNSHLFTEIRGVVYEAELQVIMSWLDLTVKCPIPRERMAKLLVQIASAERRSPFSLATAQIYTSKSTNW